MGGWVLRQFLGRKYGCLGWIYLKKSDWGVPLSIIYEVNNEIAVKLNFLGSFHGFCGGSSFFWGNIKKISKFNVLIPIKLKFKIQYLNPNKINVKIETQLFVLHYIHWKSNTRIKIWCEIKNSSWARTFIDQFEFSSIVKSYIHLFLFLITIDPSSWSPFWQLN